MNKIHYKIYRRRITGQDVMIYGDRWPASHTHIISVELYFNEEKYNYAPVSIAPFQLRTVVANILKKMANGIINITLKPR